MRIEIHHYIHASPGEIVAISSIKRSLEEIDRKLTLVIGQGVKIMKANDQVLAYLEQVNATTNGLAASSEAQSVAIANIAADIEKLLAAEDSGLPEETVAALQASVDKLNALAAAEANQATTLEGLAAQVPDEELPAPEPAPES